MLAIQAPEPTSIPHALLLPQCPTQATGPFRTTPYFDCSQLQMKNLGPWKAAGWGTPWQVGTNRGYSSGQKPCVHVCVQSSSPYSSPPRLYLLWSQWETYATKVESKYLKDTKVKKLTSRPYSAAGPRGEHSSCQTLTPKLLHDRPEVGGGQSGDWRIFIYPVVAKIGYCWIQVQRIEPRVNFKNILFNLLWMGRGQYVQVLQCVSKDQRKTL